LFGDPFDEYLTEVGRFASIQGLMGIMVDKSSKPYDNVQQEIDNKVYPYLCSYFPSAILDWEYDRDENNRPYLSYLKLLDEDGLYRLWWPDRWEAWRVPETGEMIAGVLVENIVDETAAVKEDEGPNKLGEIPWVWLYNMRTDTRPIGKSDIHDIARLDVSILRNLSEAEEVITYAAFPMMRKPWEEAGAKKTEDTTGVTSVLGFDPENPDSKPDWLESAVKEPIDSILAVILRKVEEIYRSANVGGMAATQIQTQAKSGAAMKAEFQLLNSKLVMKATNLEKAEKRIVRLWARWQELEEKIEGFTIERSRTYEVENLAADLENALTSQTIVKSKKFSEHLQKGIARTMLPGLDDKDYQEIDKEIEASSEEEETPPPSVGDDFFETEYDEDGNPIEAEPGDEKPGSKKVFPFQKKKE